MAPSATLTTTPEAIGKDEMAMNIKLSSAVQEMHEQLATQLDMCNNLVAQFASLRRISMTASYGCGGGGGGATPLMDRLTTRRFHPSWGNRLKSRLHSSISETVENLRQFSAGRLPALARQCDRAQSSAKDDVTLLVADFEFSLSVDAARPNSAIFDRYTFETDDRALVAAHLRRLAARLDAELDRLTNSIGFETDDSGGAMSTLAPNRTKFRRHAFALKGPTKGTTTTNNNNNNTNSSYMNNTNNNSSSTISLEPYLMMNVDAAAGGRHGATGAMPEWSVELALGRLSTGGGRFF